jgi:nucleoside-diphosphate-sugar epimerase
MLRSYIAPEDAARAFARAAECTHAGIETMLIGADDTFTDEPTLEHLRKTYGAMPRVRRPELYERNSRASVLDNARARRVLGWEPTINWPSLRPR